MWACFTITCCVFIVAVTIHDIVFRYFEHKEKMKYDEEL